MFFFACHSPLNIHPRPPSVLTHSLTPSPPLSERAASPSMQKTAKGPEGKSRQISVMFFKNKAASSAQKIAKRSEGKSTQNLLFNNDGKIWYLIMMMIGRSLLTFPMISSLDFLSPARTQNVPMHPSTHSLNPPMHPFRNQPLMLLSVP